MSRADMYYDRQGKPLDDASQWSVLHRNFDYRVVAHNRLDGWLVSTVWLGIDHSFGQGPPLIFETMVFPPGERPAEEYCERYATEADARRGHYRALLWTAGKVNGTDCGGFMVLVVPDDLRGMALHGEAVLHHVPGEPTDRRRAPACRPGGQHRHLRRARHRHPGRRAAVQLHGRPADPGGSGQFATRVGDGGQCC